MELAAVVLGEQRRILAERRRQLFQEQRDTGSAKVNFTVVVVDLLDVAGLAADHDRARAAT